jgi:hypothetical protein
MILSGIRELVKNELRELALENDPLADEQGSVRNWRLIRRRFASEADSTQVADDSSEPLEILPFVDPRQSAQRAA